MITAQALSSSRATSAAWPCSLQAHTGYLKRLSVAQANTSLMADVADEQAPPCFLILSF